MWEVTHNRRVLFGPGGLDKAGALLKAYNPGRVLVMAYDEAAACVPQACQSLSAAGLSYTLDASLRGEPSTPDVNRIAKKLTADGCGAVLAIGGGSVLDAAKAVAMLATNGGPAEAYHENRPIVRKPLPLVAVPTTAGTGSEATKVSVLYNPDTRLKKSIYSLDMIADAVILDPALTAGLPPSITVCTGVDALSHAIESYLSLDATPYTEMYSLQALGIVLEALPRCVSDPGDMDARGRMLLASYMGCVALHAGIGLAHIIAQPLGGLLKIPHGDACAIFLPHALRYNAGHATGKICTIARAFGVSGEDSPALAQEGIARVEAFLRGLGAPRSILPYLQAPLDMEDTVARVTGATGHIRCNPRPVTPDAIRETLLAVSGEQR